MERSRREKELLLLERPVLAQKNHRIMKRLDAGGFRFATGRRSGVNASVCWHDVAARVETYAFFSWRKGTVSFRGIRLHYAEG